MANVTSPVRMRANWLSDFFDAMTASHRRVVMALSLFCLIAFLPGFFQIPPSDRDEARFAQATRQMVETGDYVDIRFQDEVRYKNPIGIYWLQAGFVHAAQALGLPDAPAKIWLYRLPSLIGAIGGVLLTYWTALAFVPRPLAGLAALILASSILIGVEARLAKTDAMLLLTVMAAMGAMARFYLFPLDARERWRLAAIFWTAMAAGILIKGPLILLLAGLTAVTLCIVDRGGRWLLAMKPLPGLLWTALLVLPWFAAIVWRAGDAFFAESVGLDAIGKVATGQESHSAPPGLYFVLFFATFWPGSILAGLAAPHAWRVRKETPARFLLAWLVPAWIAFEIVLTKLPHYVLPLYPAIAILIVRAIQAQALSTHPLLTFGTVWWFVAPAATGIAAIVAAASITGHPHLVVWPFVAAAAGAGLFAWRLYAEDGPVLSTLRAAASSALLAIGVYALLIPGVPAMFPSALLDQVLSESDCEDPQAASAGYHEPSLVFLAGTKTQLTSAAGAADFLLAGGCRFALVESRQERSFVQRAEAIGLRYQREDRVTGFNINGGRQIVIGVYRAAP